MSDRPPAGRCGVLTAAGTPCPSIVDEGEHCRSHRGKGRTPKPDPMIPGVTCAGGGWSHRARVWVDGKPYCIVHARAAQAAIDEAARREEHLAAPDWLPADRHAEWRELRQQLLWPQAESATERMLLRLRANQREYEIAVEFGQP